MGSLVSTLVSTVLETTAQILSFLHRKSSQVSDYSRPSPARIKTVRPLTMALSVVIEGVVENR